jgi:predicted nuclease of predicted toxin-antitoxin system
VRLLLDEMYPARLARELRERDLDAEAVDERPSLRGLADEELLAIARC